MHLHVSLPHSAIPAVRHCLRQSARGIGSGHAAEALACGLGYGSNAALRVALAHLPDPVWVNIDPAAVARRLCELGHPADAAEMAHSVRSLVIRALDPSLTETPRERHGSNRIEVGGRYHHPDGYVVHVVAGNYRSDVGVSNFWYWRRVADDGVLEDGMLSGYGNVFCGADSSTGRGAGGMNGPGAGATKTVEFTWIGQDGQAATVSYRPTDAAIPLYSEPDGSEMALPEEWNWLCHREAAINHRYDTAERAGFAYELTVEDRCVLARMHFVNDRHPAIAREAGDIASPAP